MKIGVDTVIDVVAGELVAGDPNVVIDGFANDTRSADAQNCFVALQAERDGHDFLDAAVDIGCVAIMISNRERIPNDLGTTAVLCVTDTLAALTAIAKAERRTTLTNASIVGITGSTGKTSTKDLVAAALCESLQVHANKASFNNEIGLPLTLLDAPADADVVVVEMGARFAGNIRELCEIARPEVGIITNIGLAHVEHLGGVAGVAAVKGELLESLPSFGLAIIPFGAFSRELSRRTAATVFTIGSAQERADIRFDVLDVDRELRALVRVTTPTGVVDTRIGLRGAHQAANAAAAFAVAEYCGVSLDDAARGISAAQGSAWRMELHHLVDDITLIHDAYNANPTSMSAALRALAQLRDAPRRIAVLGAMRELGAIAIEEHRSIGALAGELGIDIVIGVGAEGDWIADGVDGLTTVERVESAVDALEFLQRNVAPGDAILVKASRAVGLEAVAQGLIGIQTLGQLGVEASQ